MNVNYVYLALAIAAGQLIEQLGAAVVAGILTYFVRKQQAAALKKYAEELKQQIAKEPTQTVKVDAGKLFQPPNRNLYN
jgi:hypothetical protein